MSETESSGLIEDPHKAEEMAYAEKPYRDAAIRREKKMRQSYAERLDEIKELVETGRYDEISKHSTDSENLYAFIEAGFNDSGRNLSPLEVAKIAKKLVDENSWRTHMVSRRDFDEGSNNHKNKFFSTNPENPDGEEVEDEEQRKVAADLIRSQGDAGHSEQPPHGWYQNPHVPFPKPSNEIPYPNASHIPKSELDKPPIDPSRTFIGDLAAEEAGKKYDDIQELKRMFKD